MFISYFLSFVNLTSFMKCNMLFSHIMYIYLIYYLLCSLGNGIC